MKMADLGDEAIDEPHPELGAQIKQLALDYSLMSAYTGFVAVDSSRRTEGKEGTTVPVPVPVPEGVKYRTTVGE
jgi:Ca-activated chloride channel family protein